MIKYEKLDKFYYKEGTKKTKEEYDKRFDNFCTIKTGLNINPIVRGSRNPESFELFCLPISNNLNLQDKIFLNSRKIKKLMGEFSPLGLSMCIKNVAINEIIKTNEIEGVRSTRKEIFDNINYNKKTKVDEIIKKYLDIIKEHYVNIQSVEKIRELYDGLFDKKDLEKDGNMLDGKHFRKEAVFISDGGKNIHSGISGEDNIINAINSLITFMNNEEMPSLFKACISHFFLEYIHPFYDGNGRFGRYIFSMYLSRKLDIFTGFSLSYAINNNKKKYGDAFLQVSNKNNYGEVTFFVETLLEVIKIGQEEIIEMLDDRLSRISYANSKLKDFKLEKEEFEIIYILAQIEIFNSTIADKKMLEGELGLSNYKLNKIIKLLIEKKLVVKENRRPVIYCLSEEVKNEIFV